MSNPVKLYVYDLSNGMAKRLSLQLTGKQIDGIWHTSVVVFGQEIFYGQGICTTPPRQSHHGTPLHVVDVGETALDQDTFNEYLDEMRQHYTADKYHLLDFNCNSFTNDCVGFLTGGSIPSWISDLPSDFLSTPFGAALRPTIDSMYRRPVPGAAPSPATIQPSPQAAAAAAAASPNPDLAASLLQAVASQAMANGFPSASGSANGVSTPSTQTLASPIHICTNSASFHSVLKSHKAVVAFFTSATCGPCRMIEPVFEQLAHNMTKTAGAGGGAGVAFVKVDLGVGMSNVVGGEFGVRVTPTFIFFKDGKKTHEMKGADQAEFKSQVDLLLWESFPPHPHAKLSLPALDKVSTSPILFTQVPALDTVSAKLASFIDASASSISQASTVKQILCTEFPTFLKGRFATDSKTKCPAPTPQLLTKWTEATKTLLNALAPNQLFPLTDMWRLAILDETIANWCATSSGTSNDPVQAILLKALSTLSKPEAQATARPYLLTTLRLFSNAFSADPLARSVMSAKRTTVTSLLVSSLLHADASVRTAAASLAFNVSAFVQKGRLEAVRTQYGPFAGSEEEGEWEVEMISAVLEAIANEVQSEDIVHRLTASLAFLLRFSPVHEAQLQPLLEVLQAKDTLRSKLEKGGCGEEGVRNADVRKLVQQVSDSLC
ncbi:hypothetical protein EIP91_002855 [Steccherinum ochraceum]|uniref:PPPDE domain-containing protein n=1 Tax=Steccherinum ochraceum TaxID=92696 RepID=A0A4R0RNX3_9APHY|nr:hypothetical protein EIP91_002855 [Steccherinum ochraceum]